MIKFSGKSNDGNRPALGIGLTREECERMLKGDLIEFTTLGMIDLPAIEVGIMAGENEGTMAVRLVELGCATMDQIRENPKPEDPPNSVDKSRVH